MAKIWMDDKVGRDKFDPYKDTLVTTGCCCPMRRRWTMSNLICLIIGCVVGLTVAALVAAGEE